MGISASTIAAYAAATTAAVGVTSAVMSHNQQMRAQGQAEDNAKKTQAQQDEAMGRANQKKADPTAALAAAMTAGKAGNAGTFLTGSTGAPLGSTSLLG
jgi:hypothetical protein